MCVYILRLPSDPSRRPLWPRAINRIGPGYSEGGVIPSDHFQLEDFTSSRHASLNLLKGAAVPSGFISFLDRCH